MAGRVRVAKLNVDENPATATRFNVRSIPTLLVLRAGQEIDRIVGVQPKAEIDATIRTRHSLRVGASPVTRAPTQTGEIASFKTKKMVSLPERITKARALVWETEKTSSLHMSHPSRRGHLQDILARLRALRVLAPVHHVLNVNELYQRELTLGDRVATWVAEAVGSWSFIIGQSMVLVGWVTLNVIGWRKSWDPYPFIMMNLLLSLQGVYTAPFIMMAQNRQAEKDRLMLQEDYETNRRVAEEVRQILNILEQHGQLLEVLLAQREQEKPPADMNQHQPSPSHEV